MISKIEQIQGDAVDFKDFRSPGRQLSGIQYGWNRKGLIEKIGEKNQTFFILKEYYDKTK